MRFRSSVWIVGVLIAAGSLGVAHAKPPKIIWLERSISAVLEEGITALVIAPGAVVAENGATADAGLMYAGGRGAVVKSTNGGVTWTPVLLLAGRAQRDDDSEFGLEEEDLERFEDSDAARQLQDSQDDLMQELGDLYGDETAEQLMLDLDSDMRQESLDNLLLEIDAMLEDRDFDNRLGRLLESGLDETEARTMAGGLLSIWQITLDPENTSAVYVAASAGLYRSLNQGLSWERILSGASVGGQGASVLTVATVAGGSTVLAGTDAGLRRSDDGGRTWQLADSGDLGSNPVRAAHCVPTTTRCIAASTRNLYLTDDGGRTWRIVQLQGVNARDIARFSATAAQPDDIWASTRKGVFLSNDGGQSWAATGLQDEPVREVTLSPDGRVVAAATQSGVQRSDDGGQSWQTLNAGLTDTRVRAISGDPSTDDGLWTASDAGLFQIFNADKSGIKDEAIRQLQTQWANEPSHPDVVHAALLHSELVSIPTDTLKTRMRLSILAPRVVFRLNYLTQRLDQENQYLQDSTGGTLDTTSRPGTTFLSTAGTDGGTIDRPQRQTTILYPALTWQVMALWDLGQILDNPLEFAIESYADSLRIQRVRTIKRVMRLLTKRRALQLKMAMERRANAPRDAQNLLKLQEFTALLNAYTGGFYNSALADAPQEPLSSQTLSPCLFAAQCPPKESVQ